MTGRAEELAPGSETGQLLCVVSKQQEGPGFEQRGVGVGGGLREDLSAR